MSDINKNIIINVEDKASSSLEKINKELNQVETNSDKAGVSTSNFSGKLKDNSNAVLENGGAMGLLNDLTGGYAMMVKDAVEASALFITSKKADTVATEADTVATVSSNTARQQGILAKIKDIAVLGASKVAQAASTVATNIATAAQWLWNIAVTSNPLVAFVVAIIATIVAIYKLTTFLISNTKANEAAAAATTLNTKKLEEQVKAMDKSTEALRINNQHRYNMAKAMGASTEELRKLALKQADEEIALAKSNAILLRNTAIREQNTLATLKASGASDEVIEGQRKLFTSANEAFQKSNEDLRNTYKKRADVVRSNEVEIATEQTAARKKASDDAAAAKKKSDDAAIAAEKKRVDDIKNINQGYIKSIEDLEADTDAKKLKLEEERAMKALDKLKATKQEKENMLKYFALREQQLEKARLDAIDVINKDYEHKQRELDADTIAEKLQLALDDQKKEEEKALADANKKGADEETKKKITDYYTNLAISTKKNFKKQQEDFDKEESDKEATRLEEVARHKEEVYRNNYEALQNIVSLGGKKLAVVGKALAIADIVRTAYNSVTGIISNTAHANSAAVAASPLTGGQPFVTNNMIQGAIGIGSTIAGAAKSIAAITSESKSIGGGGAGSVGGGAGGGQPQAQFNVVGQSNTNLLASTIANKQQQPVEAFVVGNSVTKQQELDRNKIANSTFL